jgi:hypothetical protein
MIRPKQLKAFTHASEETLSIGCITCPDRPECGGLFSSGAVISCLDWCKCSDFSQCEKVCPRNEIGYAAYFQEVRGWDFGNVPRVNRIEALKLPSVAPLIYHGSKRMKKLKVDSVVVPLINLLDSKHETFRHVSREEIFDQYKIETDAKLIISGVDIDANIEPFWSNRHSAKLIEQLSALKPDLFTCPNYSLAFGMPRQENLYNLKRILLGWSELVEAGINTALHLNARADRDWERLTEFVASRDEVTSVSFEFGTGAKRVARGKWHVAHLVKLAKASERSLQLVIRGGHNYLPQLRAAFDDVLLVDTNSFVKSVRARQRLYWLPTMKPRWVKQPYDIRLEELLQSNIEVYQRMIHFLTTPNFGFRTMSASAGYTLAR